MPGYMASTAAQVLLSVASQNMTAIQVNGHSIPEFSPTESWGGEDIKGQGWDTSATPTGSIAVHLWVTQAWHGGGHREL